MLDTNSHLAVEILSNFLSAKSSCDGVDGILFKGHQTSVWHPILIEHCPASVGLCEVAKKLEEEKKQREEEEEAEMYKGASSSSLIPIG
jgi:hypothetical protein